MSGWLDIATAGQCLVAFAAGYIGVINVMWLYNDRYYLPVIPPIVALMLIGYRSSRTVPRLAWLVIVMFGATALAGGRDAFRFNLAVREAWASLVSAGVSTSEIDAGYTWNGWEMYAHPEHLAPGLTQDDVPWINSARETEYVLSKSPIEGYTIERVLTWTDLPWPGPDRLFVLRRKEHPAQPK